MIFRLLLWQSLCLIVQLEYLSVKNVVSLNVNLNSFVKQYIEKNLLLANMYFTWIHPKLNLVILLKYVIYFVIEFHAFWNTFQCLLIPFILFRIWHRLTYQSLCQTLHKTTKIHQTMRQTSRKAGRSHVFKYTLIDWKESFTIIITHRFYSSFMYAKLGMSVLHWYEFHIVCSWYYQVGLQN